jgi:hypothetical protein
MAIQTRTIYLIGSLRNANIPLVASDLREQGHEVFDDWYAAGPEADDHWRDYERGRGHDLPQALKGHAAKHVFAFDKSHLDRCDTSVLVLPAGRSGHLELGYSSGRGKDCAILMEEEPDRYDVMYQFANLGVFFNIKDLISVLASNPSPNRDVLVCRGFDRLPTLRV